MNRKTILVLLLAAISATSWLSYTLNEWRGTHVGYAMGLATYFVIRAITKDHDFAAFFGIMMTLFINVEEIKEVLSRRG
ncbi:hypothetical protein [Enterococcus casseliflavus]|uniref:hypothetical protein n=1 Tax=Enterococcus casseliflavus TaxID=37734 RepID=UPI00232A9EF1|nr:hypothetical protein [Enterococcus casseliflavus]MDB1690054.1 hypothetical protein [Enterococcus casseliflavus]